MEVYGEIYDDFSWRNQNLNPIRHYLLRSGIRRVVDHLHSLTSKIESK